MLAQPGAGRADAGPGTSAVHVDSDVSSELPVTNQGPPPEYSNAIEAALSEHARQHYTEARVHFLEAHALFPNARTFRGLGKVEFELRNYGESVNYLQQALQSKVRPLNDKLRAETEDLLSRARVYVGEVHVHVDPGSAVITVDGLASAEGPSASFTLVAGEHVLTFDAAGRLSERRTVQVEGRRRVTLRVVLGAVAEDSQPAARSSASDSSPSPTQLRRNRWLWIGGALLVASVTAVILGVTLRPDAKVHDTDAVTTPNTPAGIMLHGWRGR